MKNKLWLFFLVCLCQSLKSQAQLTPGNECSTATSLTVGTTCSTVNYTTAGATNSAVPNPSCLGYAGNDVWFSFVVPASGKAQVKTTNTTGFTTGWSVYSGSCGSLSEIKCHNNAGVISFHDASLAGQTMYVRVWRLNSTTAGNFGICVWEPNTPANDFCAQAIPLSVGTSCIASSFGNEGCTAEPTGVAANPSCSTYLGADVWFTIQVPSSGRLKIQKTNVSNMTNSAALYSGTCGSFTQIFCGASNNFFNLNNPSLAGQTLYLRVWDNADISGDGTFTLCAWEPNTPSNDSCINAIPISVGTSCVNNTYNNQGCTAEPISVAPNPTCSNYAGGDVWFTVTVPLSGKLRIERAGIGGLNAQSALYTGTCGALTQLYCFVNSPSYNINNSSLAGQTLYLRVWAFNDAFGGGNFTLCAWEPNTPGNDMCSQAIVIPVDTTCTPTTYNNIGCTSEPLSTAPNPTCGFYQGSDVWFTIIMPASGHLRIERNGLSGLNVQSALYTGSCGAMTQLQCFSNGSTLNINNPSLAGQVLYLRIWTFNANYEGGSFNVCAFETDPPVNDFCASALPVVVGNSCMSTMFTNQGATSEPVTVAPNPTCNFYQGGDIWLTCVVPASGHLRFEKQNISGSTQVVIYSGTCGNLTQLVCMSQNTLNIHDHARAGQILYIRLFSFNSAFDNPFTVNFCAWEPNTPESDSCQYATLLTLGDTCNIMVGSSIGCTTDPGSVAPTPTCGFYAGGDMWFKFIMPASGHLRIFENTLSGGTLQYALYTGTCGAMTQVHCKNTNYGYNIHNQALAGQTMYLRYWSFNDQYIGSTYSFCVYEPSTPNNDSCNSALLLPVGTSCNLIAYTTEGCTAEPSTIAPVPTCGSFTSDDLWFKFVMPANGLLTIAKSNVSPMSLAFAIYTGTCGAFTQIACSTTSGTYTFNNPGLAGQTLYLRVWDQGVPNGTEFSLCLYNPVCFLNIDSTSLNPPSCNLSSNGSLTVHATCLACTGTLQYSINGGSYQASNTFTNLAQGAYVVNVRDSGNPSCIVGVVPNPFLLATVQATNYYEDSDGDGFGKSNVSVISCSAPANYVLYAGDCNDQNNLIFPGALEIPCNGIDENCNGLFDDEPAEIHVVSNCIGITDGDITVSEADGTSFGEVSLGQLVTQTFQIQNPGIDTLFVSQISLGGPGASSFTLGGFVAGFQVLPGDMFSFTISFHPGSVGLKQATVTILSNDCDEGVYNFAIQGTGTNSIFTKLDVKLFIEGYYQGSLSMVPVLMNQGIETCPDYCDTITVELKDPTFYNTAYSVKGILKTDGHALVRFPNVQGSYYLCIKHRNGLQTWSAMPVSFSLGALTSYDFTTASGMAFGNNQQQVETNVWACYSGDLNLDENIDLLDLSLLDNDIFNFESGYRSADINGDGNVDLLDSPIPELNNNNFIFSIHP